MSDASFIFLLFLFGLLFIGYYVYVFPSGVLGGVRSGDVEAEFAEAFRYAVGGIFEFDDEGVKFAADGVLGTLFFKCAGGCAEGSVVVVDGVCVPDGFAEALLPGFSGAVEGELEGLDRRWQLRGRPVVEREAEAPAEGLYAQGCSAGFSVGGVPGDVWCGDVEEGEELKVDAGFVFPYVERRCCDGSALQGDFERFIVYDFSARAVDEDGSAWEVAEGVVVEEAPGGVFSGLGERYV
jgi:hypothetical protein